MRFSLHPRAVLIALALSCGLSGCALFEDGWTAWVQGDGQEEVASAKPTSESPLESIPSPRDAITIEFIFVERPPNDPLLGDQLWDDVAKVGELTPEARDRLKDNGLRLGHIGSTPPTALETMLGLNSEIFDNEETRDSKRLVVRRLTIPSGGEAEIQTRPLLPHCAIPVRTDTSMRMKEYETARCVFRVKAERLQDGWARLEFQPEIHHGTVRSRRVPVAGGWQMSHAQKIDPLFSQRFAVQLSVGEMAIISTEKSGKGSLGETFFVLENESSTKVQRLLLVRLADMSRATATPAD